MQPLSDGYFLGRANAPPTPFIVPGFQCYQDTGATTVSGSGNKVQLIRAKHQGVQFTAAADPSGLTIATVSGRTTFLADPNVGGGSVELTGSINTPGHLHKFHFLAWVRPNANVGTGFPFVNDFKFAAGGETLISLGTLNGNPSITGQLAYNVSPATTGTRTWTETEFGSFGNWYLLSMEINEPGGIYRLRVYSTTGSLLATVNTSVAVPAGARLRCDSGELTYTFFNVGDGTSTNNYGLIYMGFGETFTDAMVSSIIAAGFA